MLRGSVKHLSDETSVLKIRQLLHEKGGFPLEQSPLVSITSLIELLTARTNQLNSLRESATSVGQVLQEAIKLPRRRPRKKKTS